MSEDEILEYLRTHILVLEKYIIQYNGKKVDTINGKTESWTIIRKLPFFEEGEI